MGEKVRTAIEMRVEGRESPGRTTRDCGRRERVTSNQQPQPQYSTPQRDRRIMLRTRAQGRGARNRIEDDGGEVKERKKPQRRCRCHLRNVDKKRVRLEAADPYNVEREAKGAQGLS